MPTLIVGGESQIGSYLINSKFGVKHRCVGTTRKKNSARNFLYLDLNLSAINVDFSEYDCIILCAGVTNINKCEEFASQSRLINELNTINLINQCATKNTFVIFLSSNSVFDGEKPFYKVTDTPNPNTNYAKQKLAVEHHILNNSSINGCVLRLTKVISKDANFIARWNYEASRNMNIYCSRQRMLSPISLSEVAQALDILVTKKIKGLYHLSSKQEISYYDYAREYFSGTPSIQKLIKPELPEDALGEKKYYNSLETFLP